MRKIIIAALLCLLLVSSAMAITAPNLLQLNGRNVATSWIKGYSNIQGTNGNFSSMHVGNGSYAGNITISSGTLMVNGQAVCLQNGSFCNSTGTGNITGGGTAQWIAQFTTGSNINTSNIRRSGSWIGINTIPIITLDVNGTSSGDGIRMGTEAASAYASSFRIDKRGNASDASAVPANAEEIGSINARPWNGSTYVKRTNILFYSAGQHNATNSGMDILIQTTMRGTNTLTTPMRITGNGVIITNSTTITTTVGAERLIIDGGANITGTLYVGNNCFIGATSYPACSATYESCLAYNWTLHKRVECNSTAWNALY